MSVSHAAVAAAIFTSGVFVNMPSPASTPSPATADKLPDVGILAAAPFRFKADREIFKRLPETPVDPRFFMEREQWKPTDSEIAHRNLWAPGESL
ncbi:hypothetical protein [Caballeronia humi]|nr:hypothetical protein [Caballeronia humi]